jgi:hypothetical protein
MTAMPCGGSISLAAARTRNRREKRQPGRSCRRTLRKHIATSTNPINYSRYQCGFIRFIPPRWNDVLAYGQVKTELRKNRWIQSYVSIRFIGDTRVTIGEYSPEELSESSFILAGGVHTTPWHGVTGWFEAGVGDELRDGPCVARLLRGVVGGNGARCRRRPVFSSIRVPTACT